MAQARPKRGAKTEAPTQEKTTTARTPRGGKAVKEDKKELPTSGKTVKFLLVEKVKKFLAKVGVPESDIFDIAEKKVKNSEGDSALVCFVNFSDTTDEINDDFNKETMKNILWYSYTEPMDTRGKGFFIEVIKADEENADIMVFQEFQS